MILLTVLLTVVCMSVLKMFGNWTFGTLVFTVMVITVTLKVNYTQSYALITNKFFFRMVLANIYIFLDDNLYYTHFNAYCISHDIKTYLLYFLSCLTIMTYCEYVYFSNIVTVFGLYWIYAACPVQNGNNPNQPRNMRTSQACRYYTLESVS